MLDKEACVALTWLDRNEMIANPEKFHALLVKKDRTDTTGHSNSIQGRTIKSEASVKLLGVNLDHRLKFDLHISDLCKKAATQLNVQGVPENLCPVYRKITTKRQKVLTILLYDVSLEMSN